MTCLSYIAGCSGLELTDEEIALFGDAPPWGFILFARNVDTPEQVAALCAELRAVSNQPHAPIFIDQEGGRVQRLKPPHWPKYPTGELLGNIYRNDKATGERAAWVMSRLHAFDLLKLGINSDCLPVLDIPVKGAHDVIGDRAYGYDVATVVALGRAAANGLLAGGVLPVIKHIPGHGRSMADSHLSLPIVDASREDLEAVDFAPFAALADLPMAMTAHVVYSQLDPDSPATTSAYVIDTIIRQQIGFDGLLMSDDLSMKALSGDFAERTKSCFEAGCDVVLHCNGLMEEMRKIIRETPELSGQAAQRAEAALAQANNADSSDEVALRAEFDRLCGALV